MSVFTSVLVILVREDRKGSYYDYGERSPPVVQQTGEPAIHASQKREWALYCLYTGWYLYIYIHVCVRVCVCGGCVCGGVCA